MKTGDAVTCTYKGVVFDGVIAGETLGCWIVKINKMTDEIQTLRNNNFDPEGCIVLHGAYITEVTNDSEANRAG